MAGAAAAELSRRVRGMKSRPKAAVVVALSATAALGALFLYLLPLTHIRWGQRFPAETFVAVTGPAPGCVSADDPAALIETDTMSRNLQRGCRIVIDLAGYTHDIRAVTETTGSTLHNRAWQRYALGYLRSGSVAFVVRFDDGSHFDPSTVATLNQWPVLAQAGSSSLLSPRP
jgi:hypothetical protein